MTTDWAAEQAEVYEDIKDEGFSVTVRRPGLPGEWNDTTGEYEGGTDPTDYPTYALKTRRNLVDATGTIVQTDVTVLLIPAYGLPADFNVNDEVRIGTDEQDVIRIVPTDPGNAPLRHEVYIG